MMRRLFPLVLALCCNAQSPRRTAHPQDVPHPSTGQSVPLSDDALFAESRSQLLLPAQYLPGPGAQLLGLEFMALLSGTVQYASLTITVSPVPSTAARSAVFAANLPQPATVVQLVNHTRMWTGTSWQGFTTTAPYVHDGTSSLTIDIQKVAVPGFVGNGVSTGLHRPDLPVMNVAFGGQGSAMNLATTAAWGVMPIDVRLVWGNAPTSRLSSPIQYGSNSHGFVMGTSLSHVVGAAPGSLAGLLGDVQWPTPVALPFAAGLWHAQAAMLGLDVVGSTGEAVRFYAIPYVPSLAGQHLVYQAIVLDALTGLLQFTNGTDCYLEP